MQRRSRSLMRFVLFSSLHEERQEEHESELVGERPAPVQPPGYGIGSAVEDPVEIIAERDAVQRMLAQLQEALRLCFLLSVVETVLTRDRSAALSLRHRHEATALAG